MKLSIRSLDKNMVKFVNEEEGTIFCYALCDDLNDFVRGIDYDFDFGSDCIFKDISELCDCIRTVIMNCHNETVTFEFDD
jgi:hypothetical protein